MTDQPTQCEGTCELKPTPKLILVGESTCPNCEIAKSVLMKDGKFGNINYIDEKHPEFNGIVEKFQLSKFPTFITEDNKVCKLNGTIDKYNLKCNDGSEVEI